ncbi:DegT/DnrJ/EryC1/StrS family aminotransferase [Candidatus Nitrospira bockiana]
MSTFLPFHVPDIGPEEVESVLATLQSGWLTTGAKVKEFEDAFAAMIGVRHAVAVNSCTAALHLALDAVGLQEGDEVLVPAMTFAATAEVVTYFKAKPVLIDVVPGTLTLDPHAIERAVTPRTKAIIPVHFAGHPCAMDRILDVARAYNLWVIEDAAHALPARFRGKMVGTIGDLTCFSFYATKNVTTGEGGMVTTDNPGWAARMRMMSLHGLSRDAWNRYTAQGAWAYDILHAGFKYNLTDLAAAVGVPQLRKCEAFWKARERYAAIYREGLSDLPEVRLPQTDDDVQHAWHLYVIQLELDRLRIGRDAFIDRLKQEGIGCSVHFIPLHLHSYYRIAWGYRPTDCPVATRVFERIISLPIYPRMTEHDVDRVVSVVRQLIGDYRL